MSLKSKIEAVIYASEEPVTLLQLVGLLAEEAQADLDQLAALQGSLPLHSDEVVTGFRKSEELSSLDAGMQDVPATETPEDPTTTPEESSALNEPLPSDTAVGEEADASGTEANRKQQRDRDRAVREHVRHICDDLIRDYADNDRGIEIREVASGFRMGTKPEFHDAVRGFVKSLKPALRLTLPALETLAVVAYKQPVTAAEISEIRGVDSGGVLGGLMTRKLIATAGRKQVIGRPMLYKTTRDFLLRFGLKDVGELPSMEEFERMAGELAEQEDLPMEAADTLIEQANARGDAEHIREANDAAATDKHNNQHATAESAAGGNHEEGNREAGNTATDHHSDPQSEEGREG